MPPIIKTHDIDISAITGGALNTSLTFEYLRELLSVSDAENAVDDMLYSLTCYDIEEGESGKIFDPLLDSLITWVYGYFKETNEIPLDYGGISKVVKNSILTMYHNYSDVSSSHQGNAIKFCEMLATNTIMSWSKQKNKIEFLVDNLLKRLYFFYKIHLLTNVTYSTFVSSTLSDKILHKEIRKKFYNDLQMATTPPFTVKGKSFAGKLQKKNEESRYDKIYVDSSDYTDVRIVAINHKLVVNNIAQFGERYSRYLQHDEARHFRRWCFMTDTDKFMVLKILNVYA